LDNPARELIRSRLTQVKAFLAQDAPPRLSESDTKAHFLEPIIAALGWEGIEVVRREYFVRNSQEFIDYVMFGPPKPLLAIEAKPLQVALAEKHAAQLVQYCAVEGIEWAALTNGRELQFFNTFLKPDLAAKRVFRLDLLAFNSEAEFDVIFEQLWQLSRERVTHPAVMRTWLNQRRLDAALRELMTNPESAVLRYVRKALAAREVSANGEVIARWFHLHLAPAFVAPPNPPPPGPVPAPGDPTSPHAETVVTIPPTSGGHLGGSPAPLSGGPAIRAVADALRQRVSGAFADTKWRETAYYVAAASG